MVRSILLTISLLLVSVAAVVAQTTLAGTVKDEATGEALIGATVKIMKGAQIVRGGVTNFDGEYRLQLDPGTYDVEVSYSGYSSVKTSGVQVLSGKITPFDVKMASGVTLGPVTIKSYKVPLIEKDKTASGQVLTSETIKNLPTRNVNAIVASTAGTTSIDGGNVNIKGSRDNATRYYIDGMVVNGTVPTQDIEQLEVITGGLGAEYGDVTGGVVSITTKGPASKFSGGIEVENSKGLDAFGYTLATANVSGPIVKRKHDDGSEDAVIGFRLSGQYQDRKDDDPPATKVPHLKESVLRNLYENPVKLVGGKPVSVLQHMTNDSVDFYNYRPFNGSKIADLTGKLDFRLSSQMDLSVTGTYRDSRDQFTPNTNWHDKNWVLANAQNNPTGYERTMRGIVRFRHRLGSDSKAGSGGKDAASSRKFSVSNASYSLQAGFERTDKRNEDPRHGDRIWDYGYVGTFNYDFNPTFGLWTGVDSLGNPTQWIGQNGTNEFFTGYAPGYVDPVTHQTISPNPGLVNYNKFVQDPTLYESYIANNGGVQDQYAYGWGKNFTNISQVYNRFSKSQDDRLMLQASASFDLRLGNAGTHNIQFGLTSEQRTSREYVLSPVDLWQLAYLKSNSRINGVDTTKIIGYDTLPIVGQVPLYQNLLRPAEDQKFYDKIRQKLGVSEYDYVNIRALRPDQMSLDMFSALELTNRNDVTYRGYDYLGNKLSSGITFNDFFTHKDADGVRDFPVAELNPLYQAAFIKDKFQFKDLIFSIGLRVERFDLNTKVMKDPYSLYEITSAKEYFRDYAEAPPRPASVGDEFKIYTKSETDLTPRAYRSGDIWYDAKGVQQNDGNLVFGTSPVVPLLKNEDQNGDILNANYDPNSSFTDYTPQVNWLPRLAFSFPISDDANFFAHYDVLVQRPPSNWEVTPLNYVYFYTTDRTPENNANLKPERVVDYEVGFKQKLNNISAITFSAYYKELRDMLQLRSVLYVPTITKYTTFSNIDFGTTKGFTLQYDLRRTNNFEMRMAYTLQFADGTGSDAESQRNSLVLGQLRRIYALNYDERHNISAILDYRFASGKAYSGPRVGGKNILANFGVNMQISAVSGRPFTQKEIPQPFGASGTVGSVNGSRKPWRMNVDMRVDKSFALTAKGSKHALNLNVYFRVSNLLDIRNVVGVYGYTGSATDDGYLATSEGQSVLAGAQALGLYQAYNDNYQWALHDPNNYTQPRRMYIGAALDF